MESEAKVVPIIVGALATVTRNSKSYLKEIGVNVNDPISTEVCSSWYCKNFAKNT